MQRIKLHRLKCLDTTETSCCSSFRVSALNGLGLGLIFFEQKLSASFIHGNMADTINLKKTFVPILSFFLFFQLQVNGTVSNTFDDNENEVRFS